MNTRQHQEKEDKVDEATKLDEYNQE